VSTTNAHNQKIDDGEGTLEKEPRTLWWGLGNELTLTGKRSDGRKKAEETGRERANWENRQQVGE